MVYDQQSVADGCNYNKVPTQTFELVVSRERGTHMLSCDALSVADEAAWLDKGRLSFW